MKYLTICKNHNNSITIKDSITDVSITYYGYTLRQAEKKHREKMNLKNKHFIKNIIIW